MNPFDKQKKSMGYAAVAANSSYACWHLVHHIFGGKTAYQTMMTHGERIEVIGLLALFKELDINPLFTKQV